MIVFVDTSAFHAGLDRDDINHKRAKNAWTDLLAGDARLLTSNYVLLETSALVQKRLGPAALRLFCQDVVPLLAVDNSRSESSCRWVNWTCVRTMLA